MYYTRRFTGMNVCTEFLACILNHPWQKEKKQSHHMKNTCRSINSWITKRNRTWFIWTHEGPRIYMFFPPTFFFLWFFSLFSFFQAVELWAGRAVHLLRWIAKSTHACAVFSTGAYFYISNSCASRTTLTVEFTVDHYNILENNACYEEGFQRYIIMCIRHLLPNSVNSKVASRAIF